MIDVLLAFFDIFWKVAVVLSLYYAIKHIYKACDKIDESKIKPLYKYGIAILFYVVIIIGCVVLGLYARSDKEEPVDLLDPRSIAAETKFETCWYHRPDPEDRKSLDMLDYINRFKRMDCPEFLLYLDTCDAECKRFSIRKIRRNFFKSKDTE